MYRRKDSLPVQNSSTRHGNEHKREYPFHANKCERSVTCRSSKNLYRQSQYKQRLYGRQYQQKLPQQEMRPTSRDKFFILKKDDTFSGSMTDRFGSPKANTFVRISEGFYYSPGYSALDRKSATYQSQKSLQLQKQQKSAQQDMSSKLVKPAFLKRNDVFSGSMTDRVKFPKADNIPKPPHKNQQKLPQQDMRSKSKKKPVIIKKGDTFSTLMTDGFGSPKTNTAGILSEEFRKDLKQSVMSPTFEHKGTEIERIRLMIFELQHESVSQMKKIIQLSHNDLKAAIGDVKRLTNQNCQLTCMVQKLEDEREKLKQDKNKAVLDYQKIVKAFYEDETADYEGLAVEDISRQIEAWKKQIKMRTVSQETKNKFEATKNVRQSREEALQNYLEIYIEQVQAQNNRMSQLIEKLRSLIGCTDSRQLVFGYIQALSIQLDNPHKNIEETLLLVKQQFDAKLAADQDYQLINKVIDMVIELCYKSTNNALRNMVYSLDGLVSADSNSLKGSDKNYESSLDIIPKMNEFLRLNKDKQQLIFFMISKIEELIRLLVGKKTDQIIQLKCKYDILIAKKLSAVEQLQKSKKLHSYEVQRYKTLTEKHRTLVYNFDSKVKELNDLDEQQLKLKTLHSQLEQQFKHQTGHNKQLSRQLTELRSKYQDLGKNSQTDKINLQTDIWSLIKDLQFSEQQYAKICREVAMALQKTFNIEVQVGPDTEFIKHMEKYMQRAQYFLASKMFLPLSQSHEKTYLIDFLENFKKRPIDRIKLVYSYDPQNAQYFKYILNPTQAYGNYLLLFKSLQNTIFGVFFENVAACEQDNFGGFMFQLTYGKRFFKRYKVDEKVKISHFQQDDSLLCFGKNELKISRTRPTQVSIASNFDGYFELNNGALLTGEKGNHVKLQDVELYQISFR